MRVRTLTWVLTWVLLIGAGVWWPGGVSAAEFRVGQKLPRFTLKTTDGKTLSPATLKNRPFWMTFFASG